MGLDKFGGWSDLLLRLCAGKNLESDEAEALVSEILSGRAEETQIAGVLVALRSKGETADEIVGFVRAMLDAAEPLAVPEKTIDIVGTGGSSRRREKALNISTMASFVAAGAGATVCKHGNRRASSTSGAFDMLDALGIDTAVSPTDVARQVSKYGLGFAFARTFHPAMRHAGPVRTTLGIPTIFNILGPLSHPGGVRRQVVGCSEAQLGDRMIEVFRKMGSEHTWIVTGDGGLDEISLSGPTRVLELYQGSVREFQLDPNSYGIHCVDLNYLPGGGPKENAAIAESLFSGEELGPALDIVLLNAAAGVFLGGVVDDFQSGLEAARESVKNGRAMTVLEKLRAESL